MKGEVHLWRGIAESLARALLATPSKGGICQLTDEQHAVLATYNRAANIAGATHSPRIGHPEIRRPRSERLRERAATGSGE